MSNAKGPGTALPPPELQTFLAIEQSALDAIPTGLCVCGETGVLLRYNRRAVELWGRAPRLHDPAELDRGAFRRYGPDGNPLPFSSSPVATALRTGETLLGAEVTIERPDGLRVPVLMNVAPLKSASGSVEGAVCSFQEFTERKRAEEQLRTLSEQLGAEVERRTLERDRIWNVSEDLLAVGNFDGYFISINPAWTRLLGWSSDQIKSMHVSDLRHPDDAPHAEEGRARLARGVPTVRLENRFRHKDGSWRWLQWTMTENDGLLYVVGRHITAEREAAAALEQAQRRAAHLQKMEAIGQLTGGIAHDFNNLLMIVSGHAEGLKNRLTDPKDLRALQAIEMAAARGENLTRQMLSFSRTLPLDATVIGLADAVPALRDVLAGSLNVNVELVIDVPKTTWPVRADKSELELALVNLAVNARDAMPDGGRLTISADNVELHAGEIPGGPTGDAVALNVADTGSGIPPELLPRVVEPFFTTKIRTRGPGLA